MSAEAFDPHLFDRITDPEEKIRGVEVATESILLIRRLIAERKQRLEIERNERVVDLGIVRHLDTAIKELEDELEDQLAFLEEFDPALYQALKDL